ncbi:MAG TPA: GNAT family N-acetyltransferase [Dehalococcoidia bacterium]|nr:GNAT family N-acetyltransferase [Dehalococcoidia bacterium]
MTAAVQFRRATHADAQAIAVLHADSWRRHYRGAYADAYLDGDVVDDRLQAWSERLRADDARRCTIVAEGEGALLGFAHTVLDDDPEWGALLDNLHVTYGRKRGGIGSRLLALTAQAVVEHRRDSGLYLWVLEQNVDAQAFYAARGGECVGRKPVTPPGGVEGRLNGAPEAFRYAWRDPSTLLRLL